MPTRIAHNTATARDWMGAAFGQRQVRSRWTEDDGVFEVAAEAATGTVFTLRISREVIEDAPEDTLRRRLDSPRVIRLFSPTHRRVLVTSEEIVVQE